MNFDLRRPCPHCPFRSDRPGFLRRDRAREIADSLKTGATFSCHATNEFDEEGEAVEEGQHCAGAAIVLEKEGRPNQLMRISERIGFYDRTKLDMEAPVFDSLRAFVAHHGKRTSVLRFGGGRE